MKITPAKLKFYALIFLILLIILTSIVFHTKGYHFLFYKDLEQMSFGRFLPLVYLSLYIFSCFFPLPFLALFGAAIFPFYEAFFLSIIGNILFFTITFYLIRWFGREYVEIYEKKHPKIKELNIHFNKNSFLYIFFFRLAFVIPRHLVNTLAALSKMRFRDYIIASILGAIPVVLVSTLLINSYQMKEFYLIIVFLILLALFVILPVSLIRGLRRYFKKM